MLPESLSKFFEAVFEPYFTKNVAIVAVTQPHSFRFVNEKKPDQRFVWVGSCTQNNILSAIDAHGAFMIGYAKDSEKSGKNTQKFNCHKLNEFGVGAPMEANNFGTVATYDNAHEIQTLSMASVIEHFAKSESTSYEKNIKFYKELLNDEKENQ